jgi:hypothetical protein
MSKSTHIDDHLARESKATKGRAMHLAERVFDGFRSYAAALQVPSSLGFNAGVVVKTERAIEGRRVEVFRDERLDDGRVWMDPERAFSCALDVGQAAVSVQRALVTTGM